MESILPLDYYTSMIGIMVDQTIFHELVTVKMPEVIEKFTELQLESTFFTLQWFVCLFSSTLNKQVLMKNKASLLILFKKKILNIVWDNLFVFGVKTFLKVGIVILSMIKVSFEKVKDFGKFFNLFFLKKIMMTGELLLTIEEQSKTISDIAEFQKNLHELYLSGSKINFIAEHLRNQFKKEFDLKAKQRTHKKRKLSQICDIDEPICYEYMEENRNKKESLPAFVFRQKEKSIYLIKNYLLSEK